MPKKGEQILKIEEDGSTIEGIIQTLKFDNTLKKVFYVAKAIDGRVFSGYVMPEKEQLELKASKY